MTLSWSDDVELPVPKLWDVCLFAGELDVLELRVAALAPVVSGHVLVESSRTFQNGRRALTPEGALPAGVDRWAPEAWPRALTASGVSPWERERWSRERMAKALPAAADDEDLVLLGDVDEVPSAELLAGALAAHAQGRGGLPAALVCQLHYYGLDVLVEAELPNQPVLATVGMLRRVGGHRLRVERPARRVPAAGWHYSYAGGVEAIREKLRSFAHAEFSGAEFSDPRAIRAAVAGRRDLLGRDLRMRMVDVRGPWAAPGCVREDPGRWLGLLVEPWRSGVGVAPAGAGGVG